MKWLRSVLLALALLVPIAGYAQPSRPASDEKAIAGVWGAYEAALGDGDIDAWLALWTKDGIQLPPGEPSVAGFDALKARNGAALGAFDVTMDINLEESVILGDFAYSRGTYTARFTPKAGGPAMPVDGKFLSILVRQADGSWRIHRDMFNSNTGPS